MVGVSNQFHGRAARGCALAVFALGMAGMPSLAHADVMQIGGEGGYEWVAGGPDRAPKGLPEEAAMMVGAAEPSDPDAPVAAVDASSYEVRSITDALDAAGPTKWRTRVAQLAAKYDISPALLEAVVWQESRWNELAVSPVGARGLAQLMPGTAAQMGVNPHDPMANLEGGARYLRMQLDAFGGNIEKALAAYNAGPARVEKAGGIPNIRETKAYVASIMARLADPVRQ